MTRKEVWWTVGPTLFILIFGVGQANCHFKRQDDIHSANIKSLNRLRQKTNDRLDNMALRLKHVQGTLTDLSLKEQQANARHRWPAGHKAD